MNLQIPVAFDEAKTYPLVVVLHGYTANGFVEAAYFGLGALLDSSDAFVVAPDGLVDSHDAPYWNADPACCDFDHANPDDVGYLGGLIDDISDVWPIDRRAVFVVGHANGGYMAYRLACDRADAVAAIVVLAGAASLMPSACQPAQQVSVLHLHGTADNEMAYGGGGPFNTSPSSPGAVESVTRWAQYDGCEPARVRGAAIDLDTAVDGPETHPDTFGCTAPVAVELWTMDGSAHIPGLTTAFVPVVWPWLDHHRRRADPPTL